MAAYTTIDDPSLYFDTLSYTGDMSTDRDITGLGFQPDFVWVKNRATTNYHNIKDSVRGTSVVIFANNSDAEISDSDRVTAFLSNGFTVSNSADTNGSGNSMVAWCWKESATAGFDIATWTGNGSNQTISHSLSAVPHFFVTKGRTFSSDWHVGHKSWNYSNDEFIHLNSTGAKSNTSPDNYIFNGTAPTSSVFSVGYGTGVNKSSETYIAYLWTEKQGYSKISTYSGNNNADGAFVYTGFKPAFILLKKTDGTDSWLLFDNKRSPFNPVDDQLYANSSDAEADADAVDFVSNGFKFRGNGGGYNGNNDYIYMAFAEAPFVNSNGVPCNAR